MKLYYRKYYDETMRDDKYEYLLYVGYMGLFHFSVIDFSRVQYRPQDQEYPEEIDFQYADKYARWNKYTLCLHTVYEVDLEGLGEFVKDAPYPRSILSDIDGACERFYKYTVTTTDAGYRKAGIVLYRLLEAIQGMD